jgi:uncharacterized protein YfaS (alpha-2-macroglobulin family)
MESALPAAVPFIIRNMPEATVFGTVLTDADTARLLEAWDPVSCSSSGRRYRDCAIDPLRRLGLPSPGRYMLHVRPSGESGGIGALVSVPLHDLVKGRERDGAVFAGTGERINSFELFQVTDLALTVKAGALGTLAWVTRLSDGRSVSGATVKALDCAGRVLWTGETGEDGLAFLPGAGVLRVLMTRSCRVSELPLALHFAAAKDGERVFWSLDWDGAFGRKTVGIWWTGSPFDPGRLDCSLVHSRPVYRTGDNAEFKMIARRESVDGLSTQVAGPARVMVLDPGGETAFDRQAEIGPYGTVPVKFPVPSDGACGDWKVLLDLAPEKNRNAETLQSCYGMTDCAVAGKISVRFCRSPAFTLSLVRTPDRLAGERAVFGGVAEYGSGKPLDGGEAAFELYCENDRSWRPAGFGREWSFSEQPPLSRDYPGGWAARGRTGLARDGSATFGAVIPEGGPRSCSLAVTVTDSLGRTSVRTSSFAGLPASLLPGLMAEGRTGEPGRPFTMRMAAVTPDGAHVPGVSVRVSLFKRVSREWRLDPGGYYAFGSGAGADSDSEDILVSVQELTSGDGPVAFEVTPEEGRHCVTAELTDPEGRKAAANSFCFHAPDDRMAVRHGDRNGMVELEADRKSYVPGDVARVLVRSPFSEGTGLVTVERGGIRQARTFDLGAGQPVMEIPLSESDSPAVHVGAVLARGRTAPPGQGGADGEDPGKPAFRSGYLRLKVNSVHDILNVDVTTDRTDAAPGDRVAVKVRVTRTDATPYDDCEVAIIVGDAGLEKEFDRPGFEPENLMRLAAPLRVVTVSTLAGIPARVERNSSDLEPPKDGFFFLPDLAPGLLNFRTLADLRRDIGPAPFFVPQLVPDANGEAEASFILPGGSSEFRVTAVATGRDRAAGIGEAMITVIGEPVTNPPPHVRAGGGS